VCSTLLLLLSLGCNGTLAPAPEFAGNPSEDCATPSFQGRREVVEAGSMKESADPCWWLSSGAILAVDQGVARTIQGALPAGSIWREHYAKSSPVDTDDGAHPQNLFRLVTREKWLDYRQEVRFRTMRVNLSASPERGEWSGIFLFQRYQDSDNLYYAGLRMDGTAVIKKKLNGTYVTLAQRPVFAQPDLYDRYANPSLLPAERWLELASVIRTEPNAQVRITLFARGVSGGNGWQVAAEALDGGEHGAPIRAAGHAGLRSDFMDLEFDSYAIVSE
jgi:hypothetical protein